MNGRVARSVEFDMGYATAEFERVLPMAMRDWTVVGRAPQWRIDDRGTPIAEIHIDPRRDRVMGALSLPVLHVTIRFVGVDDALRDTFMFRFERGFQRGGG